MRRLIGLVLLIVLTGCTRIPDCADETGCIAFTSNRYRGIPHIFIMRPDGSQMTRIATGEDPAWSPDGKQIAFTGTPDRNEHSYIYLMDTDGSDVVRLTDIEGANPSWSPDGRYIMFGCEGRANQLCAVALADRTSVQYFDFASFFYGVGRVTWSPDGSRVAIDACTYGADGEIEDLEIFVVGTECIGVSGECEPSITRLTDNEVNDFDPAWSPDGNRILFSRASEPGWEAQADIWVMDGDGANAARLTGSDTDDSYPDWSPDGRRIVYVMVKVIGEGRGGAHHLVAMDSDGSHATRLLAEGGLVWLRGDDTTLPIGSWDPDWWGVIPAETILGSNRGWSFSRLHSYTR